MRSLRNKVVVITGSTSGIGAATAERFAWSGATLVLADGDEAALSRQRDHFCGTASQPLTVQTDVTDFGSLRTMFQTTLHRFGVVDVLVNCAGVIRPGPSDTNTPELIVEQLHVNVLGTIIPTQLLLPTFRRQGKGHFIHVMWIGGSVPLPLEAPYAATVAAICGFCQAMSLELRKTPTNISIVCADVETSNDANVSIQDPLRPSQLRPPSVYDVARTIWRTARRPRLEVHVPRLKCGFVKLACLSPRLLERLHSFCRRHRTHALR